ncbi:MAG: prolipoprotein diacylglyceryl transferase [Kiritimatiellae bacterium]|nr:prolipoprotein diacylglyceryl transferase [Kiritimatiellia bacterium]
MDPVCFYVGSRPVYWYGIMVALGFLAGAAHLTILGVREGRSPGFGSDLAFWLMLSGIVGARLAYVTANIHVYLQNPWNIIRIDQGGLIYYGGFIGAFLAGVVFARIKHLNILALADYAVPALPLGHAFGRIGCFLNGCCHGKAASLPWSVFQHDAHRHPVQLYEAALNLLIYGLLLLAYRRRKKNGEVLAIYCMTYSLGRFLLEFLRGDERLCWLGTPVAQLVSLALFAAGLALWIALARKPSRPGR